MREWGAAALAALALTVTAGCAGVPSAGAVHVGRALPAGSGLDDLDLRVVPPSWQVGLGPQQVFNGFLRALVNADDDYAIARSFLTPAAAASWRATAGITTYDESQIVQSQATGVPGSHATIQLRAPRVGHIDEHGNYEPARGTLTASFSLVRQTTNAWRIDRLPNGVLLSAADAQRSFRIGDVYYFNRERTRLVPQQVLLQSSQRGIATALVAGLLAGPNDWLSPAVHTAIPRGTSLLGNVPVHDNGVADVNLSAVVRLASGADLAALSAQIVTTLRQVSGVAAVRLLAEGSPLPVPGVGGRQAVSAWARYDPSSPPASSDVVYVGERGLAGTAGDVDALRRSDPGNAVNVARSRADYLAVVQRVADGRERLLTGRLGERLRPRTVAARMTAPTFTASGDVVTAASTGDATQVLAVTPGGAMRTLATDAGAIGQPPRALLLSPDGARVAVITAAGSLLVGRVAGNPGGEQLSGFRAIAPDLHDVRGLVWADADTLAVTAAGADRARQVVETDAVGYAAHRISVEGLRGQPVDVAAMPGQPLIVATSDGVIWTDVEGWRVLAHGTAPVHSG